MVKTLAEKPNVTYLFFEQSSRYLLKFVNAEMNHVRTLTDSEFFDRSISISCTTFEDAPIGVQSGYNVGLLILGFLWS